MNADTSTRTTNNNKEYNSNNNNNSNKNSNMWLPRLRYQRNDNLLKCHVKADEWRICVNAWVRAFGEIPGEREWMKWRELVSEGERKKGGGDLQGKRRKGSDWEDESWIVKLYMQMHHNFRKHRIERRKIFNAHTHKRRLALWMCKAVIGNNTFYMKRSSRTKVVEPSWTFST